MPVDNTIYDRMADTWWNEDGLLHMLRPVANPARFGYFRDVWVRRLGVDPAGKRALDVGCGGGLLAEEFAELGCEVTGIDPSARSISVARAHAAHVGRHIRYCVGAGEALPFDEGSFDMVYCCDVLEHVHDVERVIAETARVLRPGSLYFYDTINRTWWSRLVMIKFAQEWEWSRLLPSDIHDWNKFITPHELDQLMTKHGLENRDVVGMQLGSNPIELIRTVRQFKRGEIRLGELGRRIALKAGPDTSGSYMGYATKRG